MHTGNLLDKIKRFTKKSPVDNVQIITDHKYVQQAMILSRSPFRIAATKEKQALTVSELCRELGEINQQSEECSFPVVRMLFVPSKDASPLATRILTLRQLSQTNGNLNLHADYLPEGAHILLKYRNKHQDCLMAGTVSNVQHKFENEETVHLTNVVFLNDQYEITGDHTDLFFLSYEASNYEIIEYLSEEEFETYWHEIKIHELLKQKIPFAKDDFLQELKNELLAIAMNNKVEC